MASLIDVEISRAFDTPGEPDEDLSYLSMESVFTAPEIGRDERRMQVRAYNYWLGQTTGGELPAIEELHPERLGDIGTNGVLVDLTLGLARPAIIYLGEALAAECGDVREIFGLGDVPERSLLSRLTEHCFEVVASRAPIGFDAEFVDRTGQVILYRSILLPYSSDGKSIDFVFGVISWKQAGGVEAVAASEPACLAQIEPVPNREAPPASSQMTTAPGLPDLLAEARAAARLAIASEDRSHRALYAAVSRLYDCLLAARRQPGTLETILAALSLPWQERAPLVGLARLVFGPDWPRSRLSELALVLAHAERLGLGAGRLEAILLAAPGGLKGLVSIERGLQRAAAPGRTERTVVRPALAHRLRRLAPAKIDETGEFTLLLARRESDGRLAVLGSPDDLALLEAAAKRIV